MKKLISGILIKTRLTVLWKIMEKMNERGILNTLRYIGFKLTYISCIDKVREYFVEREFKNILSKNSGKSVILSLSFIDWDVPLYQRPQHIAIQLAKQGFLYFYHTRNYYDYINGYKHIGDNMYLTNRFDEVLQRIQGEDKYIHLYSTNMYEDDDERIGLALEKGFKVIYEYIDEISEKISGQKIPRFVLDRHERLLKDEKNVIVIATATKLYNDVAKYRKKNFKLVTNGVVYEHFRDIKNVIPEEMKSIVEEKKPIIGYYGALATWFDYKLVRDIANLRKDWNIVLIGWDYDGSLAKSGLNKLKNVHVLKPVDYHRLPLYAQWFDVCTIPFLINDVTESTSPVKLFEYMALGKPIVTTPMPECKKYQSVIIAKNEGKDFVEKIEEGLKDKENKKYMRLLEREALENTWEGKAGDVIEFMKL
jgi:glycosyltransferase involved in cell wall biosynthesis